MRKTLVFLIIVVTMCACGPSAEELARLEKIKTDSLFAEAKEQVQLEMEHKEQVAWLKNQLIELKAQLAGEDARLNTIMHLKVLVSENEKAKQVADQTKIIEELKVELEEINNQLKELE